MKLLYMESDLSLAVAPEISLDRSCQGPSGLFHLVGLPKGSKYQYRIYL